MLGILWRTGTSWKRNTGKHLGAWPLSAITCRAIAELQHSPVTCAKHWRPNTRTRPVVAVPVNDREEGYDYPPRVRFEMAERDLESYRRAADFLNITNVDLVCLQHEFGIFGGPAGSHILALLRELRMPAVTTLHTVLRDPDPQQRKVMKELSELSDRLVVMSERGQSFLRDTYAIPARKVDLIPHGVPDVAFVDPNFYKDRFGAEGKLVLLTFGLLSPNKGIENVIEALPEILSRHPRVLYMVLGATHPHVLRGEGEAYRLMLQRLVRERGVQQSVVFHNRFVTLEELVEFIGAADIYITPTSTENRLHRARWPTRWAPGKRSSPPATGTPRNY